MRALPFVLILLAGCASLPPLEDQHFAITCRRGDKADECLVRVRATISPPPPIGRNIAAEVKLVEGRVELEIKGWRHPEPGEEERVVEAKVGYRPGVPFVFVLLDQGHRDTYTITIPEQGEARIEPGAGEFSERG
jgi:hypothetical protein